ncbi:MAG: heavy metal translocating P-type ATPase [Candidatus Azobacteroides sp.]|nr:heavy metal translocating P-type ATPase [Candidatus Azobacteroides sp.]
MNDMTVKKTIPVLGMGCASCAVRVENIVRNQAGVVHAAVNFASTDLIVEYHPETVSPEKLQKAVQEAGYDLFIDETEEDFSEALNEIRTKEFNQLKFKVITAIILSLPVVVVGMFFMDVPWANGFIGILSAPVVFYLGKDFFIHAWKQAKRRSANMDTLVALSVGIAYLFSVFNTLFPDFWRKRGIEPHVYFEASCVIVTFVLLGRLLEEKAKGSASFALKKLMGLQSKTVTVAGEEGKPISIPVQKVAIGDIILVKPGEKIAVDGSVIEGSSYIDESMFSGEPVPVLKQVSDKVWTGTINQKGSFRFKAEKIGSHTMLAQIIRMVQEAQNSKPPVQKMADKIAGIFVPAVMGVALIAFVFWIGLGGANGFSYGLLAFVTVLVVACPCALGLATPTAIMVGIGKGAERGILIKDAESLELAPKVNAVVLDKTGTITEGKPVVTDLIWLDQKESGKNILAGLESRSEHPLAEAIVSYLDELSANSVSDFENVAGKGVRGRVEGRQYFVGSGRWLTENKIKVSDNLFKEADSLKRQAKTIVWFADDQQALALIAVADQIKESSPEAVRQLQSYGIEAYMLTGDQELAAKEIAKKTGINHYRSGCLPQQKADFIKELQDQGKVVAMIGDGINDSTALACADWSIAMGKGSDIAMDIAQVTIISSDLIKLPEAIRLSKQTIATIRQNLFWAFIYNLIGIPLAAGILYPINGFLLNPAIAGAAMALSSLSVVMNSLRSRKG